MRLLRTTMQHERRSLHLCREGLAMIVERPSVSQDWYISMRIDLPWPFLKEKT
jgi:hypothetical protein